MGATDTFGGVTGLVELLTDSAGFAVALAVILILSGIFGAGVSFTAEEPTDGVVIKGFLISLSFFSTVTFSDVEGTVAPDTFPAVGFLVMVTSSAALTDFSCGGKVNEGGTNFVSFFSSCFTITSFLTSAFVSSFDSTVILIDLAGTFESSFFKVDLL